MYCKIKVWNLWHFVWLCVSLGSLHLNFWEKTVLTSLASYSVLWHLADLGQKLRPPPPLPMSWKKSSCLLHKFFFFFFFSHTEFFLLKLWPSHFLQLVSLINNSLLNLTVRPISFKFPELYTTFDVFSFICLISNRFIYVSHKTSTVLFKMEPYKKYFYSYKVICCLKPSEFIAWEKRNTFWPKWSLHQHKATSFLWKRSLFSEACVLNTIRTTDNKFFYFPCSDNVPIKIVYITSMSLLRDSICYHLFIWYIFSNIKSEPNSNSNNTWYSIWVWVYIIFIVL